MSEVLAPEICPSCTSHKVVRDYQSEGINIQESQKTLGSLADKNTSKFSSDQKENLAKQNKTKAQTGFGTAQFEGKYNAYKPK